jgi:DNA-binding MarR family transcriptional regulator
MISPTDAFLTTLREWVEVFMRRSMQNVIQYAKASGLSMSQMSTLMFLKRKGSSGVSDIGEDLGITSAAASQMLDRLVQQGLIQRSEDPHDRRLKHIILSERGREVMQEGIRARQEWQDQLVTLLTPDEMEQVIAALRILIDKANQLGELTGQSQPIEPLH